MNIVFMQVPFTQSYPGRMGSNTVYYLQRQEKTKGNQARTWYISDISDTSVTK